MTAVTIVIIIIIIIRHKLGLYRTVSASFNSDFKKVFQLVFVHLVYLIYKLALFFGTLLFILLHVAAVLIYRFLVSRHLVLLPTLPSFLQSADH